MNDLADRVVQIFESNPSGHRPVEFKVLVEVEVSEAEKRLKAMGLEPSDSAKERMDAAATIGRIVAMSPHAFTYADTWPAGSKPKIGDRVAIGKYSGSNVPCKDGVDRKLNNDKDIASVLEF